VSERPVAPTTTPLPGGHPPGAGDEGPVEHDLRGVLRLTAFRRLWAVLALSSFGDWLGLLATTSLAATLAGLDTGQIAQANLAVSAVFVLRLAPALLLGPFAGVVADRFDRRTILVVGDLIRGLLFLSIPLVGELWWLFVATVLIEITAVFWMPAKEALVPNLVPRTRLETANQLSVAATYGSAPVAALFFALLAGVVTALEGAGVGVPGDVVAIALVINALTFLVAAAVVADLPLPSAARRAAAPAQAVWHDVVEGWRYIVGHRFVRGLVGGMLGAFAAAGTVIALGVTYAASLGAGRAGYGVLFGAAFLGMAIGVWQAPRSLAGLPRRRLFGTAIVTAGVFLVVIGLSPHIVVSTIAALGLGAGAGAAWITGQTLLGGEVDDAVRGRTFAFVQTAVRVVLVAVMAAAAALAAVVPPLTAGPFDWSGTALVFVLAGVLAIVVGVLSRLAMDPPGARPAAGRPAQRPARGASRRARAGGVDGSTPAPAQPAAVAARAPRHRRATAVPVPSARGPEGTGFFIAVEGGDGAGKSTQVQLLVDWLIEELGHETVMTREPGGTTLGRGIRGLVLTAGETGAPVPRAEVLLFAADRAQHVETVLRPALARGAVVVSDRYVDSSLAYQGARGELDAADIASISRWATLGLRPDLTVVLDLDPQLAAARLVDRRAAGGPDRDRLESETGGFRATVRETFLRLAAADPQHYVVVDAARSSVEVADDVQRAARRVLPLSRHQRAVLAARLAADEDGRRAREGAAVAEAQTWLSDLDARL
jgi:dTMP kinase